MRLPRAMSAAERVPGSSSQMFTVWVEEEGEPPEETKKEQPEEEEEIFENVSLC